MWRASLAGGAFSTKKQLSLCDQAGRKQGLNSTQTMCFLTSDLLTVSATSRTLLLVVCPISLLLPEAEQRVDLMGSWENPLDTRLGTLLVVIH